MDLLQARLIDTRLQEARCHCAPYTGHQEQGIQFIPVSKFIASFIPDTHTHTPNRIQEHPRQTELMQCFCHPFIKTFLAYTSNCGGHRRENQSQTSMEANLFNIYAPSRPSNMARKTIPSIPAAPQRQPPSGTLHAGYLSSHVICRRS